jgi:DNA primase
MFELESKKKLINHLYPISELIGVSSTTKNIECLFHKETSPSAHIYPSNVIWCFSCHKIFKCTDIIWKKKLKLDDYFEELVNKYGENRLEEILEELKVNDKPKEEKVIRQEGESFLDFSKRYFEVKE